MLGHQLGQHLVLVLDLLFQKLDALLFRGMILAAFALEGGSPVLEELFLPTIKHRWLEPILLAEIRDRNLVEQVPPQNDHFLFPGVMLALFSHTSSPFILTEERSSPFPAEAGHKQKAISSCGWASRGSVLVAATWQYVSAVTRSDPCGDKSEFWNAAFEVGKPDG